MWTAVRVRWACKCDQKTGLNLRWDPAELGFTAWWLQDCPFPSLGNEHTIFCCLFWISASKISGKYLVAMLKLGRLFTIFCHCWQLCCVNNHSVKMNSSTKWWGMGNCIQRLPLKEILTKEQAILQSISGIFLKHWGLVFRNQIY